MDLLEFGMRNRRSRSAVKRCLAEAALKIEIVRADLLEKKLDRMHIALPEDMDSEKMLEEIWRRIHEIEEAECKK